MNMLNQLKLKILSASMISIFIVVIAITGAINVANTIKLRQRADSILNLISDYNGALPQDPTEIEDRVGFNVNNETPFQTRYFVIYADEHGGIVDMQTSNISSVSDEQLKELAEFTYKRANNSRGTISQYRFLVRDQGGTGKMIAFLDRSQDYDSESQLLAISVFISLVGLCVILGVLVMVSNKILKPFVLNQEKQKQFITDAGHELKTPLAIIRTNAEVLEVCYGKNEWLDSIQNQTTRLDGLVKGLLQMSRSNEFSADNEHIKFSLSGTVNDVAESFRTMAEQKGHKMHFDITPEIEYTGNAQSISTLVSILIDNAIKYAADDGEIFVSLNHGGKGSGKTAVLTVANDTDISNDVDPTRFFERFYRSESSRSRESGGYGIGLSVAKSIVDNHKGKISVNKTGDKISFVVAL